MISDVLHDAVFRIEEYQRNLPHMYDRIREDIDRVKREMKGLQEKLDTPQFIALKQSEIENVLQTPQQSSEDFMLAFSEQYGSAAEIWMQPIQLAELITLYRSGEYSFCSVGSSDRRDQLLGEGWQLFAEENNYDNFEAILMRRITN